MNSTDKNITLYNQNRTSISVPVLCIYSLEMNLLFGTEIDNEIYKNIDIDFYLRPFEYRMITSRDEYTLYYIGKYIRLIFSESNGYVDKNLHSYLMELFEELSEKDYPKVSRLLFNIIYKTGDSVTNFIEFNNILKPYFDGYDITLFYESMVNLNINN